MSNQISDMPFTTDTTVTAAYMVYANNRLGNVDLTIENTGESDLIFQLKSQNNTGSGFTNVGAAVTVKAKGVKTVSYNLVAKQVGFFSGSGSTNTTANITANFRNKGDLRGAQLDIVPVARKGFGWNVGFNYKTIAQKWGAPPDDPANTESDGWGGTLPPNGSNPKS